MRRLAWLGLAACLAAVVPAAAVADSVVVTVGNFFFDPPEVFIGVGDMVDWQNVQGFHSTTSDDSIWDNGAMPAPWDFQFTFDNAGDYLYYCSVHGGPQGMGMAGIVHVADVVRLAADLLGSDADPDALGRAEFKMEQDRLRMRLRAENVLATDVLDVFVNGGFIGTIALESGGGVLHLDTQNGDTVPQIQPGDEIDLLDANDDATLILSGTFQ